MIPRAIRAAFRWWTKHPWTVFWGTILIVFLLFLLYQPSEFVSRTIFLLSTTILILSFSRGIFLRWKRSKFGLLKDGLILVSLIGAIAAMAIPRVVVHRERRYIYEIKTELKNAAAAQKSYFAKNNSYKSCAPCTARDLPGYNNNPEVTTVAVVGTTDFVLVAAHEYCSGKWTYRSTTRKITGPDAINSWKCL